MGADLKKGWQETKGTVSSVQEFSTRVGRGYSVVFTYKADGSWYGGTFSTMSFYQQGESLPVFYDPTDPENNNFQRREGIMRWVYIVFFTLLGVVAIYLMLHPEVKMTNLR